MFDYRYNAFPSHLHGGAVKLKQLQARWPHQRSAPLVYVNSSTLAPWAPAALRWERRPIIWNQDGVFRQDWYGWGWRLRNRWMGLGYQRATARIWQSRFSMLQADRYLGTQLGEVLYNPVDTTVFTPRLHHRLHGTPRIILAGSWLHAVSEPALRLSRPMVVEQYPVYAWQDAPWLFRQFDMLVHLKPHDPCPTVVLEAMACGLPVIYHDSGGTPELVGEAGVTATWDTLDAALERVCDDWSTYAEKARVRAERFALPQWIEAHERIVDTLLSPTRAYARAPYAWPTTM